MSKQISSSELASIVGKLLNDSYIDDESQYQSFMTEIAQVVCNHCGGEIRHLADRDSIEGNWYVGIHGNNEIPDKSGGIWSAYDTEGDLFALSDYTVSFCQNDPELFPKYENLYVCPTCSHEWSSQWDSMCDDECPSCQAKNISPTSSNELKVDVFLFECQAEDISHAIEQADNAYPDITVLGAVPSELQRLEVGGEIYWQDPDEGLSSGMYSIKQIHSQSGSIESFDTILLVSNSAGSQAEILSSEIRL